MNVTRTTNPNGTHRYEIDGEVNMKASKVEYTHVSTYTNGAVLFHKTEAAARKTTGYKHWTKAGYQAITDGDAVPAAPATPQGPQCSACGDPSCTAADAHHTVTVFTDAQTIARPAHIPADQWDAMTSDEQAAMAAWEAEMGRTAPAQAPQAPAPRRPRVIDQWETYEGATYAYDVDGNRVIEISAKTRPNRWNGHKRSNVRGWAVIRAGVAASGTADGLRAAKAAALNALAQLDGVDVDAILPPRVRAKVRVNDAYPTEAFRGRTGRVVARKLGDDGNLYLHVDLGTETWPFRVHELDAI